MTKIIVKPWEKDFLTGKGMNTFESFREKQLDKVPDAHALAIADCELLDYYFFKGSKSFIPRLFPPEAQYPKLESWFCENFFKVLQERCDTAEVLGESLRSKFLALRRQIVNLLYIPRSMSLTETVLFFKKRLKVIGFDPSIIDEVAGYLIPGSALFLLELYARILEEKMDEGILAKFQNSITDMDSDSLRATIGKPDLLIRLWDHQREAVNRWLSSGSNGIVEMATATGKTLVGLAAALELYQKSGELKVLVMTHARAILNQWRREAIEKLGFLGDPFDDYKVPLAYKKFKVSFDTFQTVYKNPDAFACDFLIADEVHHGAAIEFRNALLVPCEYKMGLSATIEGGEKLYQLQKYLGPKVYILSFQEALKRQIIPQFEWWVHVTNLAISELEEFRSSTRSIVSLLAFISERDRQLVRRISDGRIKRLDLSDFIDLVKKARSRGVNVPREWINLEVLIHNRRRILYRSGPKVERALEIARLDAANKKCIIFAMDIETCDDICKRLELPNTFVVHSDLRENDVKSRLMNFTRSATGVLVAPKMLDEGIDVPDAEIGINVSASKTRLQLVQRIGRILRKRPGKKPVFHHFVAIPSEGDFMEQEEGLGYLDEVSWVVDTALRMGVEVRMAKSVAEIATLRERTEKFVERVFVRTGEITTSAYGTIRMRSILSAIEPATRSKLAELLSSEGGPISDERWVELLRRASTETSSGNGNMLNLSATWWLLVAGGRDPANLKDMICRQ